MILAGGPRPRTSPTGWRVARPWMVDVASGVELFRRKAGRIGVRLRRSGGDLQVRHADTSVERPSGHACGPRITRPSRSWPGSSACRCRSRAAGRRGRPAVGAGRPPAAAGRPRGRRGSAGRRRRATELVVPLGADGEDRPAAGADLLDVAQRLGVERPRGATKTLGVSGSISAIGPCFISAVGISLGVDVADLLELQAPSSATGIMEVAAEVEDAPRLRRAARPPRRSSARSPGRGRWPRGRASIASRTARPSVNEQVRGAGRAGGRAGSRPSPAPRTPWCWRRRPRGRRGGRCRRRPRGRSCCRRRCRSPASDAPAASTRGGAQGVGRLARLAEDEDERPVVERGVAIAEFARVFDLDRQVRQPLDQILADQRRVPARAAGGEDDAADAAELPGA